MDIVPLQPTPSQTLIIQLDRQNVQLNVYQKTTGLFIDVYVDDVLIIGGVICLNLVRVVRSAYLGFSGDLLFDDTQGLDDPVFSGLGTRFLLLYLSESELSAS